ncbi:MAG: hypothetical protein ACR2M5_08945 [Nakamurella sp.]
MSDSSRRVWEADVGLGRDQTTADGKVRYKAKYRDPAGRKRGAGAFTSRRAALAAAHRAETRIAEGQWEDPAGGRVSFADYVEGAWWPSRKPRSRRGPRTAPTSTGTYSSSSATSRSWQSSRRQCRRG